MTAESKDVRSVQEFGHSKERVRTPKRSHAQGTSPPKKNKGNDMCAGTDNYAKSREFTYKDGLHKKRQETVETVAWAHR